VPLSRIEVGRRPSRSSLTGRGFGAGLQLDSPLQLHTCKGGTEDETFTVDHPSPGQVYLVQFDRCLAAPQPAAGGDKEGIYLSRISFEPSNRLASRLLPGG
jgi:hypothetical protein